MPHVHEEKGEGDIVYNIFKAEKFGMHLYLVHWSPSFINTSRIWFKGFYNAFKTNFFILFSKVWK